MKRIRSMLVAGVALCACTPAWAQLDEIVVTGSRISGDDYSNIPAVTLVKRADFLVQEIRLTNDTRAADGRLRELRDTLRDLLASAARQPGMALGYGEEFLIPLTRPDQELPFDGAGKRPDTTSLSLYVKLALGPKDDVTASVERLAAFIRSARLAGRTEIEAQGDVALSIVKPERYRFEIIAQVAEDAKRLQAIVSAQCSVEIGGLSNRVSWRRSDVSELTLYIPYDVRITNCR